MSDWWEPIGETGNGSCWCEVSNMLAYVEVPGLYVQPDTAFVCAIDHIDVNIKENNRDCLILNVSNPTEFKASVKVFSENSTQMSRTLGQNALWDCRKVILEPKSQKEVVFVKKI